MISTEKTASEKASDSITLHEPDQQLDSKVSDKDTIKVESSVHKKKDPRANTLWRLGNCRTLH